MDKLRLTGKVVIPGRTHGFALVSSEPLSLWGGYDWTSGEITDQRHPLAGSNAKGKVLAVPSTRGSSTTTAVLLESIRAGTAPAAIITTGTDFFFALASVVADELYTRSVPLIALSAADFSNLRTGDDIQVEEDGAVIITRSGN